MINLMGDQMGRMENINEKGGEWRYDASIFQLFQ
jgi:hypothetical protein